MSHRFSSLKLAALLFLFGTFYSDCAYAAETVSRTAKRTEWLIEQHHHKTGFHQLRFASDAVKITNKNFGYYLISKAPDWSVYACRDDDKVVCKLSRQAYFAEQHFTPRHDRVSVNPLVGEELVGRIKTKVYRGPYHNDWVAVFKGIPGEVDELIAAFYRTQLIKGVVLKSVRTTSKAAAKHRGPLSLYMDGPSTSSRLETLSAKEIPYNSADFNVPSNLRKTSSVSTIITSTDGRKEADSIIEQMGLGEKLGKQGNK